MAVVGIALKQKIPHFALTVKGVISGYRTQRKNEEIAFVNCIQYPSALRK